MSQIKLKNIQFTRTIPYWFKLDYPFTWELCLLPWNLRSVIQRAKVLQLRLGGYWLCPQWALGQAYICKFVRIQGFSWPSSYNSCKEKWLILVQHQLLTNFLLINFFQIYFFFNTRVKGITVSLTVNERELKCMLSKNVINW